MTQALAMTGLSTQEEVIILGLKTLIKLKLNRNLNNVQTLNLTGLLSGRPSMQRWGKIFMAAFKMKHSSANHRVIKGKEFGVERPS